MNKNDKRIKLINKKFDCGLNENERIELKKLQKEICEMYPRVTKEDINTLNIMKKESDEFNKVIKKIKNKYFCPPHDFTWSNISKVGVCKKCGFRCKDK